MARIDRRNFLKLSLTAIGGISLTGCGFIGGGSGSYPVTPSGYRFYKMKDVGSKVSYDSNSFDINKFYGSVHISENGIITFDAVDEANCKGIFQLGMDFGSNYPVIDWERASIVEGELTEDNRRVSSITNYDVDESGNVASVLEADLKQSEEHYGGGLYVERDYAGHEPLLLAGHTFNYGTLMHAGIIGDMSYKNTNTLVAAHNFSTDEDSTDTQMECLIHIPDETVSNSNLMMATGSTIPDTDSQAQMIGLVDLNTIGDFSADIFVDSIDNSSSSRVSSKSAASTGCVKMKGNLNYNKDVQSRAFQLDSNDTYSSILEGSASLGGRLSAIGDVIDVVESGDKAIMTLNSNTVITTGDTIGNRTLLSINPGSYSSNGLYFYSGTSSEGKFIDDTLFVYDGFSHSVVLSSGDIVTRDGAEVERILFGTTTAHVDSEGRLAFLCSFSDGTTALMLGIPV